MRKIILFILSLSLTFFGLSSSLAADIEEVSDSQKNNISENDLHTSQGTNNYRDKSDIILEIEKNADKINYKQIIPVSGSESEILGVNPKISSGWDFLLILMFLLFPAIIKYITSTFYVNGKMSIKKSDGITFLSVIFFFILMILGISFIQNKNIDYFISKFGDKGLVPVKYNYDIVNKNIGEMKKGEGPDILLYNIGIVSKIFVSVKKVEKTVILENKEYKISIPYKEIMIDKSSLIELFNKNNGNLKKYALLNLKEKKALLYYTLLAIKSDNSQLIKEVCNSLNPYCTIREITNK